MSHSKVVWPQQHSSCSVGDTAWVTGGQGELLVWSPSPPPPRSPLRSRLLLPSQVTLLSPG